jgi:hypothetical protein
MSRRRAWITTGLVAGAGALLLAFLVRGTSDEPRTLSEVIMMEPFVARPAAAEPVNASTPTASTPEEPPPSNSGPDEARRTGPSAPLGTFVPVGDAAVAVALATGRDSYRAWVEGIRAGTPLPVEAIKLEEWIQAPVYDYLPPTRPEESLATHVEVAVAPWNPTHRLIRVGIKAEPDPAGGRVRRVRAELRFDPGQVRMHRRLASGASGEPAPAVAGVDFGPDASFTALYEVSLRMVESGAPLGSLTVSHERADGSRWERRQDLVDDGTALLGATGDFRFAAALAGLGLMLQGAPEGTLLRPDDLVRWVGRVDEYDEAGRMEFLALVMRTRSLRAR